MHKTRREPTRSKKRQLARRILRDVRKHPERYVKGVYR